MSKKEIYSPPTKAQSAKQRLEELISHDSIEYIVQNSHSYYQTIKGGNLKLYPDGYEVVLKNKSNGLLYVRNIDLLVWYDLKKEREQQIIPAVEER